MAEALMRKSLRDLGKNDIAVSSAGVSAMSGMPPSDETIALMEREGLDVAGFESDALTNDMIDDADLVLVMEAMHKEAVIERVSAARGKTFMLKEYGSPAESCASSTLDVPDPIGRPMEDYEYCFDAIKKHVERIAKLI